MGIPDGKATDSSNLDVNAPKSVRERLQRGYPQNLTSNQAFQELSRITPFSKQNFREPWQLYSSALPSSALYVIITLIVSSQQRLPRPIICRLSVTLSNLAIAIRAPHRSSREPQTKYIDGALQSEHQMYGTKKRERSINAKTIEEVMIVGSGREKVRLTRKQSTE